MGLQNLVNFGVRLGRLAASSCPRRTCTRRAGWVTGSPLRLRYIHTTPAAGQKFDKSQENIFLMGSPGSGKTTVGQILASMQGKPVLDIDNDHLENYWKMPVSQKLLDVGANRFIEEEGNATLDFTAKGHIVSLTGSNPMYKPAMEYLRKTGVVVFLDVQHEDIVHRLEKMKVSRIVGQGEGVPMLEILKYRQQFYEGNYDLRVICEAGETPESVARKVDSAYRKYHKVTQFVSTRGRKEKLTFTEVVLKGQAEDGGLFVPSGPLPSLNPGQWERLITLSYQERAVRILEKWIHPASLDSDIISDMANLAYSEENFECSKVAPMIKLADDQFVQELFHGPTASFKDSALQLMPKFFHHAMKMNKTEYRYLILVATSGDTGGAVLDGFSKIPDNSGVSVMVLFPEDGISAIQKAQMTSAAGNNVHVVGVKADFDYCQSFIKHVFTNKGLKEDLFHKKGCQISAANSINWGRLLPQVLHHVSAYLDLVKDGIVSFGDSADLCIPTGNFGNILAAYYSKMMGIPWRRLICASNVNNILTDFINTGVYDLQSRHLHMTSSPAIDILKSSNLERYLYHLTDGNSSLIEEWFNQLETDGAFSIGKEYHNQMQGMLCADWCNEEDCAHSIMNTWKETGYLIDPHTAVAKVVADRYQDPGVPLVISATAHYAKFADDVLRSTMISTTENLNPAEAFSMLETMSPVPKMHHVLKTSVINRPKLHTKVVNGSYNEIISEIELFLQRQI